VLKAVQNIVNTPESFSGGTTWLGSDNWSNSRTFDGSIDEVAIFTNSLSETQVQGLFLRALGLFTGVPPIISVPPTNRTVLQGTRLQETVVAGGIPSPTYQWQGGTNIVPGNFNSGLALAGNIADTTGGPSHGVSGSTTAMLVYSNFNSSFNAFRIIAANTYGSVTSAWARVTLLPVPTNGLWTVNFAITHTAHGATGLPYVGRGVLGTNTYWNALTGSQFNNTPPSLRDDGVTVSGINFGSTGYPGYFSSAADWPTNNLLLDTYSNFGTNGLAFVFTSIPNGKYNLALYGTDGAYADRGTTFTVNGVSQSTTNAQADFFSPDNTVIYANVVVSNRSLEVDMIPTPVVPTHNPNTEGDFNGAQIQLVKPAPYVTGITNNGSQLTLSWTAGGLMEATNVFGPWVTNTAASPYTFTPTGSMKFYRINNPNY
jgi:hypothetical protein